MIRVSAVCLAAILTFTAPLALADRPNMVLIMAVCE